MSDLLDRLQRKGFHVVGKPEGMMDTIAVVETVAPQGPEGYCPECGGPWSDGHADCARDLANRCSAIGPEARGLGRGITVLLEPLQRNAFLTSLTSSQGIPFVIGWSGNHLQRNAFGDAWELGI